MPADLRRVERAAHKAALSRQELEAAIRDARAEDVSLRELAVASGLSHETVRQIAMGVVPKSEIRRAIRARDTDEGAY